MDGGDAIARFPPAGGGGSPAGVASQERSAWLLAGMARGGCAAPASPERQWNSGVVGPCLTGSTGLAHQGQRAAARGTGRWQLGQANRERLSMEPSSCAGKAAPKSRSDGLVTRRGRRQYCQAAGNPLRAKPCAFRIVPGAKFHVEFGMIPIWVEKNYFQPSYIANGEFDFLYISSKYHPVVIELLLPAGVLCTASQLARQ